MMTKKQREWAASHDWFICNYDSPEGTGHIGVVVRDDLQPDQQKVFTDFGKLKIWAGY